MFADQRRALRAAIEFALPWGLLIPAALFTALDLGNVAGQSAWTFLAYAFLSVFTIMLVVDNHKLRQVIAKGERTATMIGELTHLSTEGALLEHHEGAGPIIMFLSFAGHETPENRRRTENRRQYEAMRSEWSDKVRAKLDSQAPEFVAEWDASKIDERPNLLLGVIKELRSRL